MLAGRKLLPAARVSPERPNWFFFANLQHSIVWRLGLSLSLVGFMAVFGILSSAVIAEKLRGAGTAINDAGKLRYSTYQASATVLQPEIDDPEDQQRTLMIPIDRFDGILRSGSIARMVPDNSAHGLRSAYESVGSSWEAEVRPLLVGAVGRVPDGVFYQELRATVDDFVIQVDRMVYLLEQRVESQVRRLGALQAACLTFAALIIVLAVRFMRRDLAVPLRELLAGAAAIRNRKFDQRIQHTGRDELGQLGSVFNLMARDLSQAYEELEQRVQQKTRTLELMYRCLRHLQDGTLVRSRYRETLREMESLLGLGRVCLCLLEPDGRRGFELADSRCEGPEQGPLCEPLSESGSLGSELGNLHFYAAGAGRSGVLSALLKDGSGLVGLLRIEVPANTEPASWQLQLVEAIAEHMALALAHQRRANRDRRLALLEERAAIARELHDSLAQSLSFLKIQVARMRAARRPGGNLAEIGSALEELHEGLNGSYQQLRELLTTFRIGINAESLDSALKSLIAQVNGAHAVLHVDLDNALVDGEIGINEEVHVLHIVREALCNVQHHAQASRVQVRLGWDTDRGQIRLTVQDDGIGIGKTSKSEHYGLPIMRERADQLGGRLEVGTGPEGGTRIELLFRPGSVGVKSRQDPLVEVREEMT
jgi:two-component system nitrate/nitrite sensor histidine kinase NarX